MKSVRTRGTAPSSSRSIARRREPERRRVVDGRDVADAPVAELEQVADRGLGAASASSRTDGWPRPSDSMTTIGSEPAARRRRIDLEEQQPVRRAGLSASADARPSRGRCSCR